MKLEKMALIALWVAHPWGSIIQGYYCAFNFAEHLQRPCRQSVLQQFPALTNDTIIVEGKELIFSRWNLYLYISETQDFSRFEKIITIFQVSVYYVFSTL